MTTLATTVGRPEAGEYAAYYEKYIARITGPDILETLDEQCRQMLLLLSGLTESDGEIRYAPGKWSVKEVVSHVCDAERIFAYRALRFGRGDATPLAGFDENEYVSHAPFAKLAPAELVEEFSAVRRATLSLFRSFDQEAWTRSGVANNNPVSVRALAYIIAGHELHHRRMLEEKYLK
jgi:hypothetical protein